MTADLEYLGGAPRTYPQFLDFSNLGDTLLALPGGVYPVATAQGWVNLPPPPADGLWATATPPVPVPVTGVPGYAVPGALWPGSPGETVDGFIEEVARAPRGFQPGNQTFDSITAQLARIDPRVVPARPAAPHRARRPRPVRRPQTLTGIAAQMTLEACGS